MCRLNFVIHQLLSRNRNRLAAYASGVKAAVARSDKGGALALDIADAFLESDLMQSLAAGQWVNGTTTTTANGNTTTTAAAADVDVDIDQDDAVHNDNGSAAAASQFDDTVEAAATAGYSDAEHAAADSGSVHDHSSAVDDTQSWADDTAADTAAAADTSAAAADRSHSPSPARAATQRASHTGAAAAGAGATGSTASAARGAHHDDGYAYSVPSDFGGSSIASESDYRGSHTRQHQQQQQQQQQRQHRHATTQQRQQQQKRKDYSGWVGDYTIGKRAAAVSDAAGTTTTAGTARGRDEAWTIPKATANSSSLNGIVQSGSVSRGSGVWEVLVDVPQRTATTAAAAAAATGGSSSSGARYRVRD
jgi:hypothetical protein